jgi:hypothetical protein
MTLVTPIAAFGLVTAAAILVPRLLPPPILRLWLLLVSAALAAVFFWVAAAMEGHLTIGVVIPLAIVCLVNALSLRVCYDCGRMAWTGKDWPLLPHTCSRCDGPLVGVAVAAPPRAAAPSGQTPGPRP